MPVRSHNYVGNLTMSAFRFRFNSFVTERAKYQSHRTDGQYTQYSALNSASVHRTGPKIPPFDSRGNYLFEYLTITCIQSNLSNIFTNIYHCFDFRTEIMPNYIFNNNIRVNSCTICHFHARYLLYKVSYLIYFTLAEFLSSSSIFCSQTLSQMSRRSRFMTRYLNLCCCSVARAWPSYGCNTAVDHSVAKICQKFWLDRHKNIAKCFCLADLLRWQIFIEFG